MQKLTPTITALLIAPFLVYAQTSSNKNVISEENKSEVTFAEPSIEAQSQKEEAGDQGPIAIEVDVPEIKIVRDTEPAKEEDKPAPAPKTPEPAPVEPSPRDKKPEEAPVPAPDTPVPPAPVSVPSVTVETNPAPAKPGDPPAPEPAPEQPATGTVKMKPAATTQPRESVPAPQEPKPSTPVSTQPARVAEPVEGRGTRDETAAVEEKKMEVQARKIRTEIKAEAVAAAKSNDPEKAKDVVSRILGVAGVAAGISANVKANRNRQEIRRINAEMVGRTEREREQSVDYLVQRFRGEQVQQVPDAYRSRSGQRGRYDSRDQRDPRGVPPHIRDQRGGRAGFDGHRHVRYQNQSEVPAILLASSALNRVEITSVQDASRRNPNPPQSRFPRAESIPKAYHAPSAVDLSYKVDAASEITQDDILFIQGSTAFADDYSNDIVLDLAYAMQDTSLGNMSFVVEGHASAEGSYELNLDLSQRRAERIVREMVRAGVSPQRLIPVGYGESEAYYPADAPENQRRYDRKVVVFRLQQ